ncbi:MAG TPA: flagellin [bacterium]|nr:flagellin [bacterium]
MSISRVNNNVAALTANRNLDRTGRQVQKSIERLSSGLRINRAGDDAAGMTIATRLRAQVRGLDRAVMNAEDGINVINVAEGALEEMTLRLDRIRVLAIQAANTGVNDIQARQALQDEVFQSIDEITRIANTTMYNTNHLLNGDFSVQTAVKPGQGGARNYGIRIDTGPSSNTLESGTHFLNIVQTKKGHQIMLPGLGKDGESFTMHTGIQNQTDLAVSLARFTTTIGLNGTAADTATVLGSGAFFNGVSIIDGDQITFSGVLADGVTRFSGVLSASAGSSFGDSSMTGSTTHLLGLINNAIDQAEMALFGVATSAEVPAAYRTTVTLAETGDNAGRLLLFNEVETINLASINLSLVRGGTLVTQAAGVTRSGPIGANSALQGQGRIGNAVTAITGSTFDTGRFLIEVQDVQGAQNRIVESDILLRNRGGSIISRTATLTGSANGLYLNGTFVNGIYTGGVSISSGDTVTLRGTEADGSTFEATYTFSLNPAADAVLNDFQFTTLSGLIQELNYRTRIYSGGTVADGVQTRFETALFTLTAQGTLQLIDDLGRNDSKLAFTLIFNDSAADTTPDYTIASSGQLIQEGFAESATIRINGGAPIRASAGEMIHYIGPEPTRPGDVRDEVLFRLGSNLSGGADYLDVEAKEYVGQLNGGPKVTFQNGAQDVVFIDNATSGVARMLTVDFDAILDITASGAGQSDPGVTLILSSVNRSMNFQIGAFAYQNFRTSIGNLSSEYLGYGPGSGRTINDIDITTIEGANEALIIVDKALDQINRTRSLLGAATNRLEGTVSNLSVASENLLTAESRLRDVDLARESSTFTQGQVLLQAGVSVLAQANFLPQSLLTLLQ